MLYPSQQTVEHPCLVPLVLGGGGGGGGGVGKGESETHGVRIRLVPAGGAGPLGLDNSDAQFAGITSASAEVRVRLIPEAEDGEISEHVCHPPAADTTVLESEGGRGNSPPEEASTGPPLLRGDSECVASLPTVT